MKWLNTLLTAKELLTDTELFIPYNPIFEQVKRIFLSYGFILCCAVCFGQATNPFDIPVRPGKTLLEDSSDTPLTHADTLPVAGIDDRESATAPLNANPFEIGQQRTVQPEVTDPNSTTESKNFLEPTVSTDTKLIVLVYFLVMLIILTLAISMNRQRFGKILKSSYNSNHLRTLHRENNAWTNGQIIILYIFFFLNTSFVLWLVLIKTYESPPFGLLSIGLGLIGFYLIRHIVMWAMSNIYNFGHEPDMHNYSIVLHNVIIGVVILPFVLVMEFFSPATFRMALLTLAAIVILIYTLRQGKSLLMSIGMRAFNPFYFFIYLCAIEIAPLMVAYKILMGAL